MNDRQMNSSPHEARTGVSRRWALRRLLGLGAGAFGAVTIRQQEIHAARRGYSGPSASGYVIVVTGGDRPGTLQTRLYVSGLVRGMTFVNYTASSIEVEVVPPESAANRNTLDPNWSFLIRIEHAGRVLWRVWRTGDEPGTYEILDFPE